MKAFYTRIRCKEILFFVLMDFTISQVTKGRLFVLVLFEFQRCIITWDLSLGCQCLRQFLSLARLGMHSLDLALDLSGVAWELMGRRFSDRALSMCRAT